MVKKENANFPLHYKHTEPRSEPDAPPGFPPQPPMIFTSSSSAVNQPPESPEIHNPASNGSAICHAYVRKPNSTGEKPPGRTTSRKRIRPQFYAPPPARKPSAAPRRKGRPPKAGLMRPRLYALPPAPEPSATPRRRGRPPKARLMPQLSHQEIETRNCNQAPSTSLISDQVLEHSSLTNISPTPHDIDAPGSANGHKSTGNVEHNNQISQVIDPKILQQVSSALQHMSETQTAVDKTKLKSKSSDMNNKNLVHMLEAIYKKHGDITKGCFLESDCMKNLVLLGISKVVQDLQGKQLKDLDMSALDSYYSIVRDAENMNINVQWLRNRLDEIREAVKLADEAKGMVEERKRRSESLADKKIEIIMRKVELQRLELEIQDIEEQLGRENGMLERLNRNIGDQTSKLAGFLHKYLMDGLV